MFIKQKWVEFLIALRYSLYLHVLALLIFSVLVTPEDIEDGSIQIWGSLKPHNKCILCGGTRSIAAMGSLRVAEAWEYNAVAVIVYCISIVIFFLLCYKVYNILEHKEAKWKKYWWH